MIELNKIYNEECLNGMKRIPDRSVDAVICDLPYGTTDLEWDNVIPLDKLWKEYKRILRPNGWALLTASNPFSALLIMSNKKNFSHQWIWDKKNTGNPLLAKKQPLKNFEDVLLFQNKDFSSNDYEKAHPLREYGRKLFEYIGNLTMKYQKILLSYTLILKEINVLDSYDQILYSLPYVQSKLIKNFRNFIKYTR